MVFAFSVWLFADVKPNPLISNNMVLQQQSSAAIWGKADPGEKISIKTSWTDKTVQTTADKNGKWKISITTPAAGGPYTMQIKGKNIIELSNILVGEVWLCSGQSNMDMVMTGYPGQPVYNANDEIAKANRYKNAIRLFKVKKDLSFEPKEEVTGTWTVCSSESLANFSATGYFFGKTLYEALGVPIGLIHCAWGGTRSEPWTSIETLKKFPEVNLTKYEQRVKGANTSSMIYNAMLKPLTNYRIKGAIWYQGESNRNEPETYAKIFPAMIQNWRRDWGYDFPFYFAQIAPFAYGAPNAIGSALLREAQYKTAQTVPNTAMAVMLDIGEQNCIHPRRKDITGQRLAYCALAKTYGLKGVAYTAPTYKSFEVKDDGSVIVKFDNMAPQGLEQIHREITGFELAGEDKVFYPARAKVQRWGKEVKVWCDKVKKPVAVRYCFKNWCVGELRGTNGLPVSSFRSDNWQCEK